LASQIVLQNWFLKGDSLFLLKISNEQVSPHQRCVVTDLKEKQSIPLSNKMFGSFGVEV
jgi:hypothetical protein